MAQPRRDGRLHIKSLIDLTGSPAGRQGFKCITAQQEGLPAYLLAAGESMSVQKL